MPSEEIVPRTFSAPSSTTSQGWTYMAVGVRVKLCGASEGQRNDLRLQGAPQCELRRFRQGGCHMLTSRYSVPELLKFGAELDGTGYDHLKVGDHTLSA